MCMIMYIYMCHLLTTAIFSHWSGFIQGDMAMYYSSLLDVGLGGVRESFQTVLSVS